jgi:two-component system, NtrC family, sensor kinase
MEKDFLISCEGDVSSLLVNANMRLPIIIMIKHFVKFRIRTEILFNIVIVMVSSMLLVSLMVLKFFRDSMSEKLKEEHSSYAFGIKNLYESTMTSSGPARTQKVLKDYLSAIASANKGLKVGLFDVTNAKVTNIFTSEENCVLTGEGLEFAMKAASKNETMQRFEYSNILWIANRITIGQTFIPIIATGSQKWVAMIESPEGYGEEKFERIKILVILYTGIFTFIVVLFGYVMLSRSIVGPLERISRRASLIAKGNLDPMIDEYPSPHNEIEELSNSIRKMTGILLGNQEELASRLKEVQRLNDALSEAQLEMLRVEKLASIGRLSSGIAHEIGNPLSAVLGYVDMLKKEVKDEEHAEFLARSEVELQRISRIIKQLLEFSRPSSSEPKLEDVNINIEGAVQNLNIGGSLKGIEVQFQKMDAAEKFLFDEGHLRQILLNIIKNSADAVKEKFKEETGGRIIINCSVSSVRDLKELNSAFFVNADKRKDDPPGKFLQHARAKTRSDDPKDAESFKKRGKAGFEMPRFMFAPDDRLVKITVEDNGTGIKFEDVPKIFDPFFTTKDPGSGTGLGLYMTANLIDSMGGYIDLISEFGKGTLFLILLPARNA